MKLPMYSGPTRSTDRAAGRVRGAKQRPVLRGAPAMERRRREQFVEPYDADAIARGGQIEAQGYRAIGQNIIRVGESIEAQAAREEELNRRIDEAEAKSQLTRAKHEYKVRMGTFRAGQANQPLETVDGDGNISRPWESSLDDYNGYSKQTLEYLKSNVLTNPAALDSFLMYQEEFDLTNTTQIQGEIRGRKIDQVEANLMDVIETSIQPAEIERAVEDGIATGAWDSAKGAELLRTNIKRAARDDIEKNVFFVSQTPLDPQFDQQFDATIQALTDTVLADDFPVQGASRGTLLTEIATVKARREVAQEKLAKEAAAAAQKQAEAAQVQDWFAGAMTGVISVSPTSKTDRKMLDSAVESAWGQILQSSPEQQREAIAQVAGSTHMLPEVMRNHITAGMVSGDPARVAQASDTITRVMQVSPTAASMGSTRIPDDMQAQALLNLKQFQAGIDPETAIANTLELTNPLNRERNEYRDNQMREEKVSERFPGWAEDATGADLSNETGFRVIQDYATVYETQYRLTGDEDVAKAMADKHVQNLWGEDQAGRTIKHPPQNYYRVNGAEEGWQFRDAMDAIREKTGGNPDPDDVVILSDSVTDRTAAQGAPTYKILTRDGDGVFQPVAGRWYPDADGMKQRLQDEKMNKLGQLRDAAVEALKSNIRPPGEFRGNTAGSDEESGFVSPRSPRRNN